MIEWAIKYNSMLLSLLKRSLITFYKSQDLEDPHSFCFSCTLKNCSYWSNWRDKTFIWHASIGFKGCSPDDVKIWFGKHKRKFLINASLILELPCVNWCVCVCRWLGSILWVGLLLLLLCVRYAASTVVSLIATYKMLASLMFIMYMSSFQL